MKRILGGLVTALLLNSCGTVANVAGGGSRYLAAFRQPHQDSTSAAELPHTVGYWDGDSVLGSASIRINRSEQKAYFYKGPTLVGVSPVATGKSTHITPPGRFKVTQKSIDHRSSLYGVIKDRATGQVINNEADTRKHKPKAGQFYEGAPMFFFLRFNGAIGMHEGHLPGYPASHGCVRLPRRMAQKFFENAQIGTPVTVE